MFSQELIFRKRNVQNKILLLNIKMIFQILPSLICNYCCTWISSQVKRNAEFVENYIDAFSHDAANDSHKNKRVLNFSFVARYFLMIEKILCFTTRKIQLFFKLDNKRKKPKIIEHLYLYTYIRLSCV